MNTQKFKSINIREIVTKALNGQPINVHSHTLFDCDDCDIDDNREIIDEFSDSLETIQILRDLKEKSYYESLKNQKGGIEDESKKEKQTDETSSELQEK